MALLKRRGSTFGDLNLVQFDDPLLEEHAQFLAVVDIPRHVSVCTPCTSTVLLARSRENMLWLQLAI